MIFAASCSECLVDRRRDLLRIDVGEWQDAGVRHNAADGGHVRPCGGLKGEAWQVALKEALEARCGR